MKKGEIREGIVEKVKFPNKGCVRLLPAEKQAEGEAEYAAVKNVIPGQRISVRITKVRRGKGEGRQLGLLVPAPEEIQAPCPHFGSCGGCLYLSLPYEKQLALKAEQVKTEDCGQITVLNPGSVSIPKGGNPNTYGVFADGVFSIRTLDGDVVKEIRL